MPLKILDFLRPKPIWMRIDYNINAMKSKL